MATTTAPAQITTPTWVYQMLHIGFTVVPILMGLDKFFNVMVEDWTIYLPEFVTDVVAGTTLMAIVGVIEIIAGIGVWLLPKIFANVVAAWLGLIIITLIIVGDFWAIALRDLGLLLGALSLGQLARQHTRPVEASEA